MMKNSKIFLSVIFMLILFSCSKKDVEKQHGDGRNKMVIEPVWVSGTVVDAVHHDAIAGAIVRTIGSAFAGLTNSLGYFLMSTDVGSTIEISYVGYYTQQRTINEPTHLGVIELVPIMEGRK